MEKKIEIKIAKARRAKFLNEHIKTGWTTTKLAEKYGMTRARMSQLLIKARIEAEIIT